MEEQKEVEKKEVAAEPKKEVDETQVVAEFNRRSKDLQRRIDEQEQTLTELREQLKQKNQTVAKDDDGEPEWLTLVEKKIRTVLDEQSRTQRQISRTTMRAFDRLENDADIGDLVKEYRDEIEDTYNGLSDNLKARPEVVKKVADAVIGRHIADIRRKKDAPEKKTLADINTSGTSIPTNKGDNSNLTPDEEAYADKHNLWDKNFDNNDIKEAYKKDKERKEKLQKK